MKVLKFIGLTLLAIILLLALTICGFKLYYYYRNPIDKEIGINETLYIPLGGQEQFIRIRGKDISNPVIIFLHGGPTSPVSYVNYTFSDFLIDDYTFIDWDQRGCGRTYLKNKNNSSMDTAVTFEQSQKDLDDLVEYACNRFSIDKIILIGHSYGTMLGSYYAFNNSQKVSYYISIGQVLSTQCEVLAYNNAFSLAKNNADDTFEMTNAYNNFLTNANLDTLQALRKYTFAYNKAPREKNVLPLGIFSPHMNLSDVAYFCNQVFNQDNITRINQSLFDYLFLTNSVLDYGTEFEMPVAFISGSDDWLTPVEGSKYYYNAISAPKKDFITIEGCGHSPQFDTPKEFSEILLLLLENSLDL